MKPQQQYGIPLSAATLLQRQKSDLSYDRGRPMMRRRYESECSNATDGAASSYTTGPPVTVTTYFGRNGMPTAGVLSLRLNCSLVFIPLAEQSHQCMLVYVMIEFTESCFHFNLRSKS